MNEINELRNMDTLDALEQGIIPPEAIDFDGSEEIRYPASDSETVARCLWEPSPGFGSFRGGILNDGIVCGQRK